MTTYPRVFILGDSVTVGRDASSPFNAYPHLVVTGLIALNGLNAQHPGALGTGGRTTGQMLADLQAWAIAPQTDLLVVQLSTNDFVHDTPLAQFQADYAALCGYLTTPHVPACVVLLTPWADPASVNALGVACSQYTAAIQSEASTLRATFPPTSSVAVVDLGPLFTTPGYHPINSVVDTYHADDHGHDATAKAVLAAVPA